MKQKPEILSMLTVPMYKASTPPKDGAIVMVAVEGGKKETPPVLQMVTYTEDLDDPGTWVWEVLHGCMAGDAFTDDEVIGWIDYYDIAEGIVSKGKEEVGS